MQLLFRKFITVILVILGVIVSPIIFADEKTNSDSKPLIFTPNNIKWGKAPESLPKGAQLAVLEGDPSKDGMFTMRIKLPANYRIPPHWHSIFEHVIVISGKLYLGMGDKFDIKQAKSLPAGSFSIMQPKMHHFAFTHDPAIIQVQDIGPWDITYINPQDDPRNKK